MRTILTLQLATSIFLALIAAAIILLVLNTALGLGFSGLIWSCFFVPFCVFLIGTLCESNSRLRNLPALLTVPILYCIIGTSFYVFGEAIDQPHPKMADGLIPLPRGWIMRAVIDCANYIPYFWVTAFLFVAIDSAFQQRLPKDRRYFASFSTLFKASSSKLAGIVFLAGFLLIIWFYGSEIIRLANREVRSPIFFPSRRVFFTCLLLWDLLWLTDCCSRPDRGTIIAAIIFLIIVICAMPVCLLAT
jgi:hypothetical protein